MLKNLGCISVTSSKRHQGPESSALAERRFAGMTLLDWVVRRVSEAQRLHQVIVVTGDVETERRLAQFVPSGVELFRSSHADPLGQMCDVLDHHDAGAIVQVCVETPLVDPALIDRLITAAEEDGNVDYASFCSANGQRAIQSQLGLLAEWFRATALRQLHRKSLSQQARHDVGSTICAHPEDYSLKLLRLPPQLDRADLRLSVQVSEDWEHAEQVVDALGWDGLEWPRIADLLEQQPMLRARMQQLNQSFTT